MYGQRIKKKGTNNDLQNTTQKAKDRAALTTLKTRVEFGCFKKGKKDHVTLVTNLVISHK